MLSLALKRGQQEIQQEQKGEQDDSVWMEVLGQVCWEYWEYVHYCHHLNEWQEVGGRKGMQEPLAFLASVEQILE